MVWDLSRAKHGDVKLFAHQLGPDAACVRPGLCKSAQSEAGSPPSRSST